jgi:DNA-binding transcriptional LysR family regulator
VDTRDIRCFLTVCRTRSFNSAAAEMYMSPQGLSNTIRRLEKELDARLFDRHSNGVTLTQCGSVFMPYAQQIIRSSEDSFEAVTRAKRNEDREP